MLPWQELFDPLEGKPGEGIVIPLLPVYDIEPLGRKTGNEHVGFSHPKGTFLRIEDEG